MPFCPKCGTEYQEGTKFYGKCGENVDGSSATAIPGAATEASATSIPAGTPAVAPAPAKAAPAPAAAPAASGEVRTVYVEYKF